MSATLDEGDAARGGVLLTLDAMLIYEDISTGLRAKRVFEHAARQFRLVGGTGKRSLKGTYVSIEPFQSAYARNLIAS